MKSITNVKICAGLTFEKVTVGFFASVQMTSVEVAPSSSRCSQNGAQGGRREGEQVLLKTFSK